MHERKFSPEKAARLDRPERYRETDFESIISQLKLEGQVVADIGAGTGFFSIPFSSFAEKVYAVDISQDMLDILKVKLENENIENISMALSTEEKIGLPDNSVDLVWMNNVFHELEGSGTLNEILRILRPGGRYAIQDAEKIEEEEGPPFEHRIARPDAIEICIDAGFKFAGEFDTGTHRKYGLIFTK